MAYNPFPKFDKAEMSGPPDTQLCTFEGYMNGLEKHGLVNYVPTGLNESYNANSQGIRLQTIANRLYVLGYLRRRIKPKNISKNKKVIYSAILQFQKEANLKNDGWVGEQTWGALDQLVSFESDIVTEQWFDGDKLKENVQFAMYRAIQARLNILGLTSSKPSVKKKDLSNRIFNKFKKLILAFKVYPKGMKFEANLFTIKLLFNQDFLSTLLKRTYKKNKEKFLIAASDTNTHDIVKKFAINCAKVELWLLGFEINFKEDTTVQYQEGSNLHKSLTSFYKDYLGYSTRKAYEKALSITPFFFWTITEVNKSNIDLSDDASEELAKEINTKDKVNTAWLFIKEKSLRLWDGLKRVWKWIKKKGKQLISKISKAIKQSAFYRYASRAFKIIKIGIGEVVESISVYVKGQISYKHIDMKFSKDMDSLIFIHRDSESKEIHQAIKKIEHQSRAFSVATRIITFVINIIKRIATGLIGWVKILWSLVRSYKEIRKLYQDFVQLAEIA